MARFCGPSISTRATMAFWTWVRRPDAAASATVVTAELKYECVMQPRWQGPQ